MEKYSPSLKYPTRYEIEQTLTEFCSRRFVENFAQSRGIFVNRATQDELAKHLSGFFYEDKDVENIREKAYRGSALKILSGFIISSQDIEFEPVNALKQLRGSNDLTNG